jgi:hypothetical protein
MSVVIEIGKVYTAAGGVIPLGVAGHVPGADLPYNQDRACRVTREAGYPCYRNHLRSLVW